ncbi:MAG: hypothetical protein GIW95_08010 [Candidatus Eremiobacteraeota bacterium]|nr:hypothetical protein [Candidatus Eremiobacteraeota bacterium]
MAMRIRARRDVETAVDSAVPMVQPAVAASPNDAAAGLEAFGAALQLAAKRLNGILGKSGVTYVKLERPLRLRVRFRGKRIGLDLDVDRQLVIVRGEGLEGEYQFDSGASVPALINLSKLSTEAGYGDPLTAAGVLKTIARDAELPRPAHLDQPPLKL